ncbi:MAG: O-acetylhomoserine aminocarboxypropyltransferase/cysteine synthase, partial [Ruminococcus sp.]|nr:O-acetylhomoserine aminocarboxypropyltransferase/cysteine synthase [Ruminococcus sp.]
MEFNTALLHTAFKSDEKTGATLTPIYQSSAFAQESPEQLEKIFNNKASGFSYTRISNPTVASFETRIAALEGGIAAVACSSGMAAVTLSLLNILSSGDEIIAGAGLFGGTIDLLDDLKALGIKTHFVNHISADSIEPLINRNTKAVFAELIGNPALDVVDIESVAKLVHDKNIPLIIDSTTATPYLINPIKHGADIVIHSTSKYINGGGNSVSGIIIDSGNFKWDEERYPTMSEYAKFGNFAYTAKLRNGLWRNVGACLSPMNAFMNSVGLETLGLRMERLCYNARELAEILANIEGISVNYPSLGKYKNLVKK